MLDLQKEILTTILALIGASIVIYAYQIPKTNPLLSIQMYDLGWLIILISIFFISLEKFIYSIAMIFITCLQLNSTITSFAFNPFEFGINQVYFGWIFAFVVFVFGAVFNSIKFYQKVKTFEKNRLCKNDAKNKYKMMLKRINSIEKRIDDKNHQLENIFKSMLNG